jgi:hypothetical protein
MATSPNDLTRQQLDELDALLQKMLAVPIATAEAPERAAAPAVPEPPAATTWRMDPPAPVLHRTPHLSSPATTFDEPAYAGRPAEAAVILESRVDSRGYARPEPPATAPRLFGFPAEPPAPVTPEPVYVPPPIQNRGTILMPGPTGFVGIDDDAPDEAITVEPPAVTFQSATTLPFNPADDTAAVPLAMSGDMPAAEAGVPILLWPVYAANKVIEGTLCLFGPPGEVFCHPAVKWLLGLTGIGLIGYAGFWAARGMGWVSGTMGG